MTSAEDETRKWNVIPISRRYWAFLTQQQAFTWNNVQLNQVRKSTALEFWEPGPPRWFSGKESACQETEVDTGSSPESGRSPRAANGNPLQYSCLGNPMDRGAWWHTVHGVAKNQTWLSTVRQIQVKQITCVSQQSVKDLGTYIL